MPCFDLTHDETDALEQMTSGFRNCHRTFAFQEGPDVDRQHLSIFLSAQNCKALASVHATLRRRRFSAKWYPCNLLR